MGDFKEWGWGEDFEMGIEEVDILLQTMVFEKPETYSYTTKASCTKRK